MYQPIPASCAVQTPPRSCRYKSGHCRRRSAGGPSQQYQNPTHTRALKFDEGACFLRLDDTRFALTNRRETRRFTFSNKGVGGAGTEPRRNGIIRAETEHPRNGTKRAEAELGGAEPNLPRSRVAEATGQSSRETAPTAPKRYSTQRHRKRRNGKVLSRRRKKNSITQPAVRLATVPSSRVCRIGKESANQRRG